MQFRGEIYPPFFNKNEEKRNYLPANRERFFFQNLKASSRVSDKKKNKFSMNPQQKQVHNIVRHVQRQ